MKFKIFTLHPDIFLSFKNTSLIARGISKGVLSIEEINWREQYGIGNYKQVDDRPYGGGSGMVLQAEPIFNALSDHEAVSPLHSSPAHITDFKVTPPNNQNFFEFKQLNPTHKKATISLTPRGFRYNQGISEWLAREFDEINLVCGRYEGFDARVDSAFDLELSIGDFILNGGEVGAMAIVESVSRLVPGFITKDTSAQHDSFSSSLNYYNENHEYIVGKNRLHKLPKNKPPQAKYTKNLFDNKQWLREIALHLEHPHFTRPEIWNNTKIPQVLLEGNHKLIQQWRSNWLTKNQ